eukprot:3568789-Amphidinium_carterae.1
MDESHCQCKSTNSMQTSTYCYWVKSYLSLLHVMKQYKLSNIVSKRGRVWRRSVSARIVFEAVALLDSMTQQSVRLDNFTFNSAMSACEKAAQWMKASLCACCSSKNRNEHAKSKPHRITHSMVWVSIKVRQFTKLLRAAMLNLFLISSLMFQKLSLETCYFMKSCKLLAICAESCTLQIANDSMFVQKACACVRACVRARARARARVRVRVRVR